jgi:3'-phosphoadenosine 5'-phosphosulfate sulfotransferase (PAPS reductase)/FAD synthetase
VIRVVQFSGGKDSTALVLWARERFGDDFVTVFCDTGWEHPLTMAYIAEMNRRLLGGRLVTLRSAKYAGMVELVQIKKRVPSRKARFCTSELKVEPSIQFVADLMAERHDEVTVYQGIRASESDQRRKAGARFWADDYDCWIERPLFDWSVEQVFEIHKQYDIEPNPLYLAGSARVGCFPCIQINHAELRRLTETMPEVWDRMAELEAAAAGRTFFPPNYIPERFCTRRDTKTGVRIPTLEDVRAYVTNPNQPEMWDDEPRTCMSVYNLCE